MADYKKCISLYKPILRNTYETAISEIENSSAKSELTEHYVLAVSALNGISPNKGESDADLNSRQVENRRKLDEQWKRFKSVQ